MEILVDGRVTTEPVDEEPEGRNWRRVEEETRERILIQIYVYIFILCKSMWYYTRNKYTV